MLTKRQQVTSLIFLGLGFILYNLSQVLGWGDEHNGVYLMFVLIAIMLLTVTYRLANMQAQLNRWEAEDERERPL